MRTISGVPANQGGLLQAIQAGTVISPTALLNLSYIYDAAGNISSISDYKVGNPQIQSFGYDALNRLTSAAASGGSQGNYGPESYSYDPTTGNLLSKAGVTYYYTDTLHTHAVTALTNGNRYRYDANGNMIYRLVSSQPYTLTYDAENRLTQVSGTATASFGFDGDGNRVVEVENGATVVYIGNYFEWHGTITDSVKYYYSGATRVAMRVGENEPVYLMGDHLGSTSVAVDESGVLVGSPQMYKAWGETRAGSVQTRYQYTGQYNQVELGIYYYNARWYDSSLGRFTSADTLIPDPNNTLDWDRYSYARNNPLTYADPSGHYSARGLDKDDGNNGCGFWCLEDQKVKAREAYKRLVLSMILANQQYVGDEHLATGVPTPPLPTVPTATPMPFPRLKTGPTLTTTPSSNTTATIFMGPTITLSPPLGWTPDYSSDEFIDSSINTIGNLTWEAVSSYDPLTPGGAYDGMPESVFAPWDKIPIPFFGGLSFEQVLKSGFLTYHLNQNRAFSMMVPLGNVDLNNGFGMDDWANSYIFLRILFYP